MSNALIPAGFDVTAVTTDASGAFTTTHSDGTQSLPTASIDQALIARQRARSIALRLFLKRK